MSTDSPEEDLTEMMASVWVKVEVFDDEVPTSTDADPIGTTSKPEQQISDVKGSQYRRVYYCNTCDFKTVHRHSLVQHTMVHKSDKPYQCEFCDYTTKYYTSVKRHMKLLHLEKKEKPEKKVAPIKVHKCDQCSYTSMYKGNLKSHSRKHLKDKPHKCAYCEYRSAYAHHVVKHERTHAPKSDAVKATPDAIEAQFPCEECGYIARYAGHLERHLQKIHKKFIDLPHKCQYCDFTAKYKWRLSLHLKRKTKDYQMKCNFCEFQSFNKCEISQHEITHFPDSSIFTPQVLNPQAKRVSKNNNPVVRCSFCDFASSDRMEVGQHENEHFADKDVLNKTVNDNLLADQSIDKPFKCDRCPYSSRFKASVERHYQRLHAESKPFKCENCNFTTKTRDQLSLHNRRSVVDAPVKCNECDFESYFKCVLANHHKMHYSFKCNICCMLFKNRGLLQRHLFVHNGQKPFQCRFCNYVSIRKHSVFCHESTHTGVKPFKCRVCDYSTVRRVFLVHHERKHLTNSKTPETTADGKCDETENYPQLTDQLVKVGFQSQPVIENLHDVSVNYEQINYNM